MRDIAIEEGGGDHFDIFVRTTFKYRVIIYPAW